MVAPKAHVDYGLYGGGLYPRTVADLAKAGAIGIKVFNTRHIKEVYPYISELGVLDHGVLYELYRSEEHTSELQSLMRISYAVFCLKKKTNTTYNIPNSHK